MALPAVVGGSVGVPIILPGSLGPGGSFTRASSASYLDGNGTLQTVGANVPRFDGPARRLLIEGTRTNLFLNSGAPATQTITLAAGTYAVSVAGTGSLTSAAGTAVGTGFGAATAAAPGVLTVTTAGTVVFTVSGTLTRAQVELGASPSSYIATTSAAATRAADSAFYSAPAPLPGSVTVYGSDVMPQAPAAGLQQYIVEANALSTGSTGNRIALRTLVGSSAVGVVPVASGVTGQSTTLGTMSPGVPLKFAITWNTVTGALRGSVNGATAAGSVSALPAPLQYLYLGNSSLPGSPLFGDLGTISIIPGLFAPDTLLQALTR